MARSPTFRAARPRSSSSGSPSPAWSLSLRLTRSTSRSGFCPSRFRRASFRACRCASRGLGGAAVLPGFWTALLLRLLRFEQKYSQLAGLCCMITQMCLLYTSVCYMKGDESEICCRLAMYIVVFVLYPKKNLNIYICDVIEPLPLVLRMSSMFMFWVTNAELITP